MMFVEWFKKRKWVAVYCSCLILCLGYTVVYFNRIRFANEAWYGGDTWEYQSEAVNYALGHGLMRFGAVESFETYKFGTGYQWEVEKGSSSDVSFLNAGKNGGVESFFTTPGYSFFVGSLYKIFGVNPIVVKRTQLFLMILIASFLPMLGYIYWKRVGFAAGILAGYMYISQYTRPLDQQWTTPGLSYPDQILSEVLITFTLFALSVIFALWEKKTNILTSAVLGLILGISLLVKGSLMFIPCLTVIFAWFWLKRKGISRWNVLIILVGISMSVVPWSIYVSKRVGKLVFISTQSDLLLLATNNEESKDGSWHPAPLRNKESFYNREEIKNLPTSVKVILFYVNHRNFVPEIFVNKINRAFQHFIFLKYVLVFLSFVFLVRLTNFALKKFPFSYKKAAIVFMFLALLAISVTKMWYFYQIYRARNDPPFSFLYSPSFLFLICIVIYLVYFFLRRKQMNLSLPPLFFIILLNFLIMTVCTLGMARIIQVMDFIFILVGIKFLLEFLFVGVKVLLRDKFLYKSIRVGIKNI